MFFNEQKEAGSLYFLIGYFGLFTQITYLSVCGMLLDKAWGEPVLFKVEITKCKCAKRSLNSGRGYCHRCAMCHSNLSAMIHHQCCCKIPGAFVAFNLQTFH
jgi:hypothetical protein